MVIRQTKKDYANNENFELSSVGGKTMSFKLYELKVCVFMGSILPKMLYWFQGAHHNYLLQCSMILILLIVYPPCCLTTPTVMSHRICAHSHTYSTLTPTDTPSLTHLYTLMLVHTHLYTGADTTHILLPIHIHIPRTKASHYSPTDQLTISSVFPL